MVAQEDPFIICGLYFRSFIVVAAFFLSEYVVSFEQVDATFWVIGEVELTNQDTLRFITLR